jgi:hypothetical protein
MAPRFNRQWYRHHVNQSGRFGDYKNEAANGNDATEPQTIGEAATRVVGKVETQGPVENETGMRESWLELYADDPDNFIDSQADIEAK